MSNDYIFISHKGERKPAHHVRIEEYMGHELPDNAHVHHKDGDKKNNFLENLMVVTPRQHREIHSTGINIDPWKQERINKYFHAIDDSFTNSQKIKICCDLFGVPLREMDKIVYGEG